MHKEFWIERWNNRQIGFDQPKPNSLLTKHFEKLSIPKNGMVFVPLTGKSIDVAWLLSNGFHVIGCELSDEAVLELFDLLNLSPKKLTWSAGIKYEAGNLTLLVGDFFDVKMSDLGHVDGVYDRASLVALPPEMRTNYSRHLLSITNSAPQLLIVFDYDQELVPGPPFSVTEKEIRTHYGDDYEISLLEELKLPNGIKGVAPATENAWLLTK